MGIDLLITDSKNEDFIRLTKLLDKDLEERNGDIQKQFDAYNKVDQIDAVVIYQDHVPAACGAFKKYDDNTAEIKRIFVAKENH